MFIEKGSGNDTRVNIGPKPTLENAQTQKAPSFISVTLRKSLIDISLTNFSILGSMSKMRHSKNLINLPIQQTENSYDK